MPDEVGAEGSRSQEIQRLGSMLEQGLISRDEYDDLKREVLGQGAKPGPAKAPPTAQRSAQAPPAAVVDPDPYRKARRRWYWVLGVSVLLVAGAMPSGDASTEERAPIVMIVGDVALVAVVVAVVALVVLAWKRRRI